MIFDFRKYHLNPHRKWRNLQPFFMTMLSCTKRLNTLSPLCSRVTSRHSCEFRLNFSLNSLQFSVFHGSPSGGFNDKEPKKYKPRLMRFKLDKNRGEFREVEASRKALNSRGVYVIDKGLCMLQWNGRSCSEKERTGVRL